MTLDENLEPIIEEIPPGVAAYHNEEQLEPAPAPEPTPAPQIDTAELVRQQVAEQLAIERQRWEAERTPQPVNDYEAELQEIAELQMEGNYIEASRKSVDLARKQAFADLNREHGVALSASGVTLAITDAESRIDDVPAEVRPYVLKEVRELGIQGPIPEPLLKKVKQLGFGAAMQAGVQIGKPAAPRTLATPGSEPPSAVPTLRIPAEMQTDANEFERAFGKSALEKAIKEAV